MWSRTASQAAMMGWQSFSSDVSNQTTGSSASLEMLLNERQVDPEMMLLSLGFGGQAPEYVPTMARVPARFLKQPSKAQGVATPWLGQQDGDAVDSVQDGEEENISGNRSPVAAAAAAVQPKRKPGGLVFNGFCYRSCQGYVDLMRLFLHRDVPRHFFNTLGSKCYQVVDEDDDDDPEVEEEDEEKESRNRGDGLGAEKEEDFRNCQVPGLAVGDDQVADGYGKQKGRILLMGQAQNPCSIGTPQPLSAFSNEDSHPAQFNVNEYSKATGHLSPSMSKTKGTKQNRGSLPTTPRTSYETSILQSEGLIDNLNSENIPKNQSQSVMGSKAAETKITKDITKAHTTTSSDSRQKSDSRLPQKVKSLFVPKGDKKALQTLPPPEAAVKNAARPVVPKTQSLASGIEANTTSPFPSSSSSLPPTNACHTSYQDQKGERLGLGAQSQEEQLKPKNSAVSSVDKCLRGKGKIADCMASAKEDAKPLSKVVEEEETGSETRQHYSTQPYTNLDVPKPETVPALDIDASIEEGTSLKTVQEDQIQALKETMESSMQSPLHSSFIPSRNGEEHLPLVALSSGEPFDVTKGNNNNLVEAMSVSNPHNDLHGWSLLSESVRNKNVGNDLMSQDSAACHVEASNGTIDENGTEDFVDNDDSYDWMDDDDEDQEDSDGSEAVLDLRGLNEMLYRIDESSPDIALNNALSDDEDDLKESDEEFERKSDSPRLSHVSAFDELRRDSLQSDNLTDVMLSERKLSNGVHDPYSRISSSSASPSSPPSRDQRDLDPKVQTHSSGGEENNRPEPCSSLADELDPNCFSSCIQASSSRISSSGGGTTSFSTLTQTPVVVTVRVTGDIRVSCVPSQTLRVTDSSNLSSASGILSVPEDGIPRAAISKRPSTLLTVGPTSTTRKENVPKSYRSEISSFCLKRPKSSDAGQRTTSVSSGNKPVSTHMAVFSTLVSSSLPRSTTTTTSEDTVLFSALHIAPNFSSSPSSLPPSKADFFHGASGAAGSTIAFDGDVMQKSSDFSEMESSFMISSSSGSDDEEDL